MSSVLAGNIFEVRPAFSADARLIFAACNDTIHVYSRTSSQKVDVFEGHSGKIVGLCLCPWDSSHIISWTRSGEVKQWYYLDGFCRATYQLCYQGAEVDIRQLVFSQHQMLAALLVADGEVVCVEAKLEGPRPEATMLFKAPVEELVISPSGKYIVVSGGREIYVWQTGSKSLHKFMHKSTTTKLCIPDHEEYVAVGDTLGAITLWHVLNPEALNSTDRPHVGRQHWHATPISAIACTPGSTYLYSGALEVVLVAWNIETQDRQFVPRLASSIQHLVPSLDGKWIILALKNNSIAVYDSQTQKVPRSIISVQTPVLENLRAKIHHVPASKNFLRNSVAVVSGGTHVQFMSAETGKQIAALQVDPRNYIAGMATRMAGVTWVLESMSLSCDAAMLTTIEKRQASILRENDPNYKGSWILKFWSIDELKKTFVCDTVTHDPHRDEITSLLSHPYDANVFYSTSLDGSLKCWRKLEDVWVCDFVADYRSKPIQRAALSSCGLHMALVHDRVVSIWDPSTATQLIAIDLAQYKLGSVNGVEFITVGYRLILLLADDSGVVALDMQTMEEVARVTGKCEMISVSQWPSSHLAVAGGGELNVYSFEHNSALNFPAFSVKTEKVLSQAFEQTLEDVILVPGEDEKAFSLANVILITADRQLIRLGSAEPHAKAKASAVVRTEYQKAFVPELENVSVPTGKSQEVALCTTTKLQHTGISNLGLPDTNAVACPPASILWSMINAACKRNQENLSDDYAYRSLENARGAAGDVVRLVQKSEVPQFLDDGAFTALFSH